jgi:hypothetical protein
MNPFLLPGTERILSWRNFRKSLENLTTLEQLEKTAEWWSKCPESFPKLDDFNMKDWPSPWQLLQEGDLCPTSIAYMIAKTIDMIDKKDIKLMLIKNTLEHIQKMVVVVDQTYVLNYDYGKIYDFQKLKQECDILVVHKI